MHDFLTAEVDTRSGRGPFTLRLVGGLFLVYTTIYIALSAISVIYLPTRVAAIAPADKEAALAIVSTIASLLVLVGQPLIGMLSDRTSGRWGRRAPWMLAGACAAVVFIPALGLAEGVAALALVWALCELSLNAIQAPAAAVVVDRVPERRRGLVSGVTGAGFLAGSAIGSALMGAVLFGSDATVWVLCLIPLGGTLAFMLLAPDRDGTSTRSASRERRAARWREALSGFAVAPWRHPGYAWMFASRTLVRFAYTALVTYLLYIAEDHLGLAPEPAAALVGVLVAVLFGASLPTLFLGGIVSDRTGRRRVVIVVATLIMAAALAIPMLVPTVPAVLVFAAIFGLAYGAYSSSSNALATLVLTDAGRNAGKDLGILNAASVLPQVLAPGLAWLVVTVTGGYEGLFAASIALMLLGGLAVTRVRPAR